MVHPPQPTLGSTEIASALEVARALARTAGELMRAGSQVGFEVKADGSELTSVDLAINDLVVSELTARYPDHRVVGEERSSGPDSELVWVCDPIDGTLPFSAGLGIAVFSLALCVRGTPVLGVVCEGATGTLWQAVRGGGAWRDEERLEVSARERVEGARIDLSIVTQALGGIADALYHRGARVIRPMSAVRTAMAVAEGRLDGVLYDGGWPWDVAASGLIVEEAGGRVGRIKGGAVRYDEALGGTMLLAAPGLWEELAGMAVQVGL